MLNPDEDASQANPESDYRPRSPVTEPVGRVVARLKDYVEEHEAKLWWIHSAWALAFGAGVMLLGVSKPSYARIIMFQVGFIWLSSLFLPILLRTPRLSGRWAERIRLLINYLNKNFYQQLLFFSLPIYYVSATFWSRNVIFLILLSGLAILSTLDVVYDRYLSLRWPVAALFLAFSAFASVNIMFLVLWAVSNSLALYLSALFALALFASMLYRFTSFRGHPFWIAFGGCALLLLALARVGAPIIPPATLSLGDATFAQVVNRQTREPVRPFKVLPAGYQGRVSVLTPIRAPFGLTEYVRHKWYLDGVLFYSSQPHEFRGGRSLGYRYWTAIKLPRGLAPRSVRVDVETATGQLIGRAFLKTAAQE
jgi:hypothetical protein